MSRFLKVVSLLSVMLLGISILLCTGTSIYAAENNDPIITTLTKKDYESVQNHKDIINTSQLKESDFYLLIESMIHL